MTFKVAIICQTCVPAHLGYKATYLAARQCQYYQYRNQENDYYCPFKNIPLMGIGNSFTVQTMLFNSKILPNKIKVKSKSSKYTIKYQI